MISTLLAISVTLGQFSPASAAELATGHVTRPPDVEVERAARQYRNWVYQTWRYDRSQFDVRWKAGEELLQAWRAADQPEDDRQALLDWFAAATQFTGGAWDQPLPPAPNLEAPVDTPPLAESLLGPASSSLQEEDSAVETSRPAAEIPSTTVPADNGVETDDPAPPLPPLSDKPQPAAATPISTAPLDLAPALEAPAL